MITRELAHAGGIMRGQSNPKKQDPNSEAYWRERGTTRPNLVWQQLTSSNNLEAYRTRVPGGWFVVVHQGHRDFGGSFFYPDPTHRWDGNGVFG